LVQRGLARAIGASEQIENRLRHRRAAPYAARRACAVT
jgi:hypothetical protein